MGRLGRRMVASDLAFVKFWRKSMSAETTRASEFPAF